ncbi:MAG: hypothetical protein AVDCRST_MAG28-148 [uncultured Rubrobacteraceae bacterium]|uniref:Uncharacterized protein n=1 Tax=uncultured Rubrobacteraceae bacterium TaxID=349277 RepID=A0A6J4Q9Q7_9ACTN|nr:MAG: hypothetical protein AVDCRST_MAG28-148 [uncultured Rubrobacteraceae bacterium]
MISRLEIETWDEEPCDEQERAKLTRPRLTETFHGNVEGRSAVKLLMAYVSADGLAPYVASSVSSAASTGGRTVSSYTTALVPPD